MKTKRMIAVVLAVLLTLSLCACGSAKQEDMPVLILKESKRVFSFAARCAQSSKFIDRKDEET